MMDKVLIDTDVILDFFFDREPFSEDSTKILHLCSIGDLKGFVTPVLISNVYYLLRKTAKHEKVAESLKMLLDMVEVSRIDKESALEALNSDFKDFEDALQHFSAKSEKEIKLILTRNIKDYKTSSLPVMTPETFLKTLNKTG